MVGLGHLHEKLAAAFGGHVAHPEDEPAPLPLPRRPTPPHETGAYHRGSLLLSYWLGGAGIARLRVALIALGYAGGLLLFAIGLGGLAVAAIIGVAAVVHPSQPGAGRGSSERCTADHGTPPTCLPAYTMHLATSPLPARWTGGSSPPTTCSGG
jgi:hypothetical protein